MIPKAFGHSDAHTISTCSYRAQCHAEVGERLLLSPNVWDFLPSCAVVSEKQLSSKELHLPTPFIFGGPLRLRFGKQKVSQSDVCFNISVMRFSTLPSPACRLDLRLRRVTDAKRFLSPVPTCCREESLCRHFDLIGVRSKCLLC